MSTLLETDAAVCRVSNYLPFTIYYSLLFFLLRPHHAPGHAGD